MGDNQPTVDLNLLTQATWRLQEHMSSRIESYFDKEALAQWFSDALSRAYQSGLRDGYVQGRHDHNKEQT